MATLNLIKNHMKRLTDEEGKINIFDLESAIREATGAEIDLVSEYKAAVIFAVIFPNIEKGETKINKYTIKFSNVRTGRGTPEFIKETIETKEYL
jgi:hypothetical protein